MKTYLCGLLLLITICIVAPSNNKLEKAPASPFKIVSLEIATNQSRAVLIRDQWTHTSAESISGYDDIPQNKTNLLYFARLNTYLDFFFILVYCTFLILFGQYVIDSYTTNVTNENQRLFKWTINNKDKLFRYLITLVIIAGLCDVIENVGMLVFMGGANISSLIFSIPAIVKFVLLIAIVVFITRLKITDFLVAATKFISSFLNIIRILPLTIISLFLLFFTLWKSDQGQDLLLTVNDHHMGPFTLYVVTVVLALMNWYFPKFFYEEKWTEKKFSEIFSSTYQTKSYGDPYEESIPRLLGTITLLIPAFGMLHTLSVFNVNYPLSSLPIGLLFAITILFIQLCYTYKLFVSFRNAYPKTFIATCLILLATPVLFWPLNKSRAFDIQWLFWGLLSYAILFSMLTAIRKEAPYKFANRVGNFISSMNITVTIWILVLPPSFLFLYFAITNFFLIQATSMTYLTLAVVFGGIIFYYALFTILNVIGKQKKINISLFLIIVLAAIASSLKNDFHLIRPEIAKENKAPSLRGYISRWLDDRKSQIPIGDSVYRIYLAKLKQEQVKKEVRRYWIPIVIAILGVVIAAGIPLYTHYADGFDKYRMQQQIKDLNMQSEVNKHIILKYVDSLYRTIPYTRLPKK